MTPKDVLDRFTQLGALLEGHFRLSSGLHSPNYLQCALVLQHPAEAEALGRELGIGAVYDDAEELLRRENVDFLDVVTDSSTHARFVELAVYPVENHGFEQETSWADEYTRILRLFETHLRLAPPSRAKAR